MRNGNVDTKVNEWWYDALGSVKAILTIYGNKTSDFFHPFLMADDEIMDFEEEQPMLPCPPTINRDGCAMGTPPATRPQSPIGLTFTHPLTLFMPFFMSRYIGTPTRYIGTI
jgi:hypothetical protein